MAGSTATATLRRRSRLPSHQRPKEFPHDRNPTREQQAAALEKDWAENPRWKGIKRGYTRRRRGAPARLAADRAHAGPAAAPRSCGSWSTPSRSSTRSAR
ncbi:MAG: hypothetical protein MZW92_30425 [Comamonadaceae bacterium]|nr:hypothetical protein [Comamonadaceae bacterium]